MSEDAFNSLMEYARANDMESFAAYYRLHLADAKPDKGELSALCVNG